MLVSATCAVNAADMSVVGRHVCVELANVVSYRQNVGVVILHVGIEDGLRDTARALLYVSVDNAGGRVVAQAAARHRSDQPAQIGAGSRGRAEPCDLAGYQVAGAVFGVEHDGPQRVDRRVRTDLNRREPRVELHGRNARPGHRSAGRNQRIVAIDGQVCGRARQRGRPGDQHDVVSRSGAGGSGDDIARARTARWTPRRRTQTAPAHRSRWSLPIAVRSV